MIVSQINLNPKFSRFDMIAMVVVALNGAVALLNMYLIAAGQVAILYAGMLTLAITIGSVGVLSERQRINYFLDADSRSNELQTEPDRQGIVAEKSNPTINLDQVVADVVQIASSAAQLAASAEQTSESISQVAFSIA